MSTESHPLELSEEQVLFFRARRSHLVSGDHSASQCAHRMIGLQAQQQGPALLALSLRMSARPTAAELQQNLFSENRDLLRTWGQRDTLHIYAARSKWFPLLDWVDDKEASLTACVSLTRRYLSINAPATTRDVAHFFGANVTAARQWLAVLDDAGELIPVDCLGRTGLVALAVDEEDLRIKPGRSLARWPLRLLPLWDTLLMSHHDKSWTVPDETNRLLVWRKAAFCQFCGPASGS